jgi:hypothetical protein
MDIVESDAFLDMPASSQLLYFHLCMRADDDGFLGNPKSIQRSIGSSDDERDQTKYQKASSWCSLMSKRKKGAQSAKPENIRGGV